MQSGLARPVARVLATTGAASVSPYPSQTVTAARVRIAVQTSAGSGAAPEEAIRMAANPRRRSASLLMASAAASQAWYIGGAPGTAVTPSVAMRVSEARGSKVSSSTAHAPAAATRPKPALSPYTWNSGRTRSTRSSGWTTGGVIARHCSWLARSAAAVSIAPLGRPVVPLV